MHLLKIVKKYARKEVNLVNLIKDYFLAGISTRRAKSTRRYSMGNKYIQILTLF
jgi:hypothetical protein